MIRTHNAFTLTPAAVRLWATAILSLPMAATNPLDQRRLIAAMIEAEQEEVACLP